MRKAVWVVLVTLSMLWSPGCGYRLQGANAPENATIEIPMFENRTVETGIEAIITERVVAELRRTPGWRVVPPGEGRYVLKGSLVKFFSEPHQVTSQRVANEHRATLFLDVTFQDRSSKKDLWRETGLRTFADYPLGSDIRFDEQGKFEAIARIAEELASRIRVRVQDTW
jgi:hypothetical protein